MRLLSKHFHHLSNLEWENFLKSIKDPDLVKNPRKLIFIRQLFIETGCFKTFKDQVTVREEEGIIEVSVMKGGYDGFICTTNNIEIEYSGRVLKKRKCVIFARRNPQRFRVIGEHPPEIMVRFISLNSFMLQVISKFSSEVYNTSHIHCFGNKACRAKFQKIILGSMKSFSMDRAIIRVVANATFA